MKELPFILSYGVSLIFYNFLDSHALGAYSELPDKPSLCTAQQN